jgi:hypothetical protein
MGGEVSYARAGHASGDARSELAGLMAWASYRVRLTLPLDLEPWAGLGALVHARRSSDYPGLDSERAGLAAELGVRGSLPMGRLRAFAGVSYVLGLGALHTRSFPSEFASVTAGIMLPLRG